MKKLVTRTLLVGGAVVATSVLLDREARLRRALKRGSDRAGRRLRYLRGVAEGARYRVGGHRPEPVVSDDILTQRVRSTIGPLEKQRDLPHVHVMVERGFVVLHGELPTDADVREIERAVGEVSGVHAIESFLHVGLTPGVARPSEGRAAQAMQPSHALRALLDAAQRAGVPSESAALAVRAALGAFLERIPEGERAQVLAHVPRDARVLAEPPRRSGGAPRTRSVPELVGVVVERAGLDAADARRVTEAVLGQLRVLVPEEVADVAAVLPPELRDLWLDAVPD